MRGVLAGTARVPSWSEFEEASGAATADVEARYLNAPLVTADSKIAGSGLVEVLW